MRSVPSLAVVVASALVAPSAHAQDVADAPAAPPGRSAMRADLPARLADPDTADGRFDGDLGLVVGAGATFRGNGSPRGVLDVRLRYLDTAGLFVTYEDGFSPKAPADPDDAPPKAPNRLIVTGLEMRPLFLARWVTGKDLGLTWPDLVIDSLGLQLGAFFGQLPGQAFSGHPGLQASVGLEVPLLARASGPWIDLRAGGRWSDAALRGIASPAGEDPEGFFTVTLAWHQLFATHIVDLGDVAP